MEGKLIDWAFGVIRSAPPIQNVAAFLVVLLAAVPLLWSGIKRFRAPAPQRVDQIEVIQQTPWLIQMITTIEQDIKHLKNAVDEHSERADKLSQSILSVDRMTRRIYERLFGEKDHK